MTPSKILQPKRSLYDSVQKALDPSIAFTSTYLSTNIPSYHSAYYIEAQTALQNSADLSTLESIGVGQQAHVTRLSALLNSLDLEQRTLADLKNTIYKRYFSFSITNLFDKPKVEEAYTLFFSTLREIQQTINQDIETVTKYQKDILSVYNKLSFYYDLFKLLSKEVVERELMTKEELPTSIIAARIVSLTTSKTVLDQLSQVVNIKLTALTTEKENITQCFTVLKVALDILQQQNKKEFEDRFKSFLKQ